MLNEPAALASCSVLYELCFSGLWSRLCRILSFAIGSSLGYLCTDLTSPAGISATMPVVPLGWARNQENHRKLLNNATTKSRKTLKQMIAGRWKE